MNMESISLGQIDGIDLTLQACEEFTSPEGSFDWQTKEERKEFYDNISSGKWLWFCAKVTASKNGHILGHDYLGGCCYESLQDFANTPGYIDDMKQEAIKEAKQAIKEVCS